MQFRDYETVYSTCRRFNPRLKEPVDHFYEQRIAAEGVRLGTNPAAGPSLAALINEHRWLKTRRPYYSVVGEWGKELTKVSLDLDGGLIPPLKADPLLVRFQVGYELPCRHLRLRSLLVGTIRGKRWMACDFGETAPDGRPVRLFQDFRTERGLPVEATLSKRLGVEHLTPGVAPISEDDEEALRLCARIVCSVSLLADAPGFIEADVLADDQHKAEAARVNGDADELARLVEKARRRGKIGWTIGASHDINPHFRRPHLAIRYKGKGRERAEIVPVSGCVVKRRSLTQVPTGYLDDEPTDAAS